MPIYRNGINYRKYTKKAPCDDEAVRLDLSDCNLRLEIWAFCVDADLSAVFVLPLEPDVAVNL